MEQAAHQASGSSAPNVFRGQIMQIVPVSAAFSETEKKMEGLMRVSMLIDPSLPR